MAELVFTTDKQDRALLETADMLSDALHRLNAHGGELSMGFTPQVVGEGGAYWYAEQALCKVLGEMMTDDELVARMRTAIADCGEPPSVIILRPISQWL